MAIVICASIVLADKFKISATSLYFKPSSLINLKIILQRGGRVSIAVYLLV